MPLALQAGFRGLFSGSALLLGALVGYFARVPQRLIAAIMAFGSGVLISALSFDLMDEAYRRGGLDAAAVGFLGGAAVYTLANIVLARAGARHRKRSGEHQAKSDSNGGAIALGALLDGIPESVVIGVSLIAGGAVGWVAVVAVFLSNVPEGLSSAAGMKTAGRSPLYVFGLWSAITLVSGLAALGGYALLQDASPNLVAGIQALAAGAILAMIADTMIPEAFEVAHDYAGMITVAGFLSAFALTKLS
ncbi:MAG TPA: hypothetical protein VF559_08100 [Caulobacteraceae bacterium]|jgi:ZIP family zinc transporter